MMNDLFQEQLRRTTDPLAIQLLTEVRDSQRQILDRMSVLESEQKRLKSGFPADDIDGHRRYHQTVIEWREHRNKMVREALSKLIGAGVLAGCGWLLLAIWQALKTTVIK